ncbi:hypothetical protein IAT38_001760 [Cryptococcus sp. DSM 104549]
MDYPPLSPTLSETSTLLSSPPPFSDKDISPHTLHHLSIAHDLDLNQSPSPADTVLLHSPLTPATPTTPVPFAPALDRTSPSPPPITAPPRERIGALDFNLAGRHAYTTTGYKPAAGQVLVGTTAKHSTLTTGLLATHCSGCLKNAEQLAAEEGRGSEKTCQRRLLACGSCEIVRYCGVKCYAKNAAAHFEECRDLARAKQVSSEIPSTMVRLVCKILRARSRGKYHDQPRLYPLVPLEEEQSSKVHNLAEQVQRFLRPKSSGLAHYGIKDYDHLLEVVHRVFTCVFMLYDDTAKPVGVGISPVISRISHGCMPNAVVVFPSGPTAEGGMRVISREWLGAGEEVTISYVDDGLPLFERETFITQSGFVHQPDCAMCSTEQVDIRWAGRHVGCKKSGLVPIFWGGSGAEDFVMPHKAECTGCSAEVPCTEINSSGYYEAMTALEHIRMKEDEGLGEPRDATEELALLQTHLKCLLQRFPPTLYPLPPLIHRLGRLLVRDHTSKSATLAGRDKLYQAWEGLLSSHNEQASPQAFWILVGLAECYLWIARTYRTNLYQLATRPDGSGVYVGPIRRKNLQEAMDHLAEARKSRVEGLASEALALEKECNEFALESDGRGAAGA